jgi:GT2 family glycosyltransferase
MIAPSLPKVTIIIPNFNGARLLRANLPSVLEAAQEYPGGCEVVVVDDGSQDGSVAVLRAEFPGVRRVEHPANRGFADAVHSGVAAADTELLVFLNSDVRPDPGFLAPLARHFEDAAVFAVAPLVAEEGGGVNPVSWRCYGIERGRFRAKRWDFDPADLRPRHSLFASGGSAMLRKSMFLALGGYAPIFKPFYSEDFDLGLRAWRRGWSTLFDPASRVVHGKSGSIKENVARARIRKIRIRNHFLLEWTHIPARDLLLRLLPGYFLQTLSRLATFNLVYFLGLAAALRRLPEALKLRAAINRSAQLGFWDIIGAIDRGGADQASPSDHG